MRSILFVCHGNICRSPMAEFLMRELARRRGVSGLYTASAATSAEELGNPPHHGTRARLAREGISCAGKRAVRLRAADYAAYDYLVGMDEYNRRDMLRLFDGDPAGKVSLLLDWTGENRDVDDPWYSGDFEAAFADISRGCGAMLDTLIRRGELPAPDAPLPHTMGRRPRDDKRGGEF